MGNLSFGAVLALGTHLAGSWLWSVIACSAPGGEQAPVNTYIKWSRQ